MSHTELVFAGSNRAALPDVSLPSPPPTRIYISGHEYRIQSPRAVLPPLINTIKLILRWAGPASKAARNILYLLKGSGPGATSDPAFLTACANTVMTQMTALVALQSSSWSLTDVTAKDNGGTSTVGASTAGAIPGTVAGTCLPPQCACVVSWKIAPVYRGGKPRMYLPGVPSNAVPTSGDSGLSGTYANNVDNQATAFLNGMNLNPISGTVVTLGTISYYSGHVVRPTPLFRSYLGAQVHERLDSQRRRSGREALFPVTP